MEIITGFFKSFAICPELLAVIAGLYVVYLFLTVAGGGWYN